MWYVIVVLVLILQASVMDGYGTDDDSTVSSTTVHSTAITVQAHFLHYSLYISIDADYMLSID